MDKRVARYELARKSSAAAPASGIIHCTIPGVEHVAPATHPRPRAPRVAQKQTRVAGIGPSSSRLARLSRAPVLAANFGQPVRRKRSGIDANLQASASEAPTAEATWLARSRGPSFNDCVPAPVGPMLPRAVVLRAPAPSTATGPPPSVSHKRARPLDMPGDEQAFPRNYRELPPAFAEEDILSLDAFPLDRLEEEDQDDYSFNNFPESSSLSWSDQVGVEDDSLPPPDPDNFVYQDLQTPSFYDEAFQSAPHSTGEPDASPPRVGEKPPRRRQRAGPHARFAEVVERAVLKVGVPWPSPPPSAPTIFKDATTQSGEQQQRPSRQRRNPPSAPTWLLLCSRCGRPPTFVALWGQPTHGPHWTESRLSPSPSFPL